MEAAGARWNGPAAALPVCQNHRLKPSVSEFPRGAAGRPLAQRLPACRRARGRGRSRDGLPEPLAGSLEKSSRPELSRQSQIYWPVSPRIALARRRHGEAAGVFFTAALDISNGGPSSRTRLSRKAERDATFIMVYRRVDQTNADASRNNAYAHCPLLPAPWLSRLGRPRRSRKKKADDIDLGQIARKNSVPLKSLSRHRNKVEELFAVVVMSFPIQGCGGPVSRFPSSFCIVLIKQMKKLPGHLFQAFSVRRAHYLLRGNLRHALAVASVIFCKAGSPTVPRRDFGMNLLRGGGEQTVTRILGDYRQSRIRRACQAASPLHGG